MTLADGRQIVATPEHPFYLPMGLIYKNLGELYEGDFVYTYDSGPLAIAKIESVREHQPVYNFEVPLDHNYFVQDVLVHNKTRD